MTSGLPDIRTFNTTELLSIIRRQMGVVVKRSVPRERLIQIIEDGTPPNPEECSGTNQTRRVLQTFLEQNWARLNSQLPCRGPNMGRCTVYQCPEGRHLDCYEAAREQIRIHIRLPDEP